jgi:predicted 2-oxoglutarate/Fe(II)-dependent dioxygenase YbiX
VNQPTRPGTFETLIDRDVASGQYHVTGLHIYHGEAVWSAERQQYECETAMVRAFAKVDTLEAAERTLSEWIAERIIATSLHRLTPTDPK